jgi:hypothetical protein
MIDPLEHAAAPLHSTSHEVIPELLRIGPAFAADAALSSGVIHSRDGERMTNLIRAVTTTSVSAL